MCSSCFVAECCGVFCLDMPFIAYPILCFVCDPIVCFYALSRCCVLLYEEVISELISESLGSCL